MLRRFARALVLALSVTACGATEPAVQPVSTDAGPGQLPNPRVLLVTSKGNIILELFSRNAPRSTANFLNYVKSGFYIDTVFHRVIPGFMIQGGGMARDLVEKPTQAPIPNEAGNGLKNLRGTLAMARTGDPQSGAAQFFINVADNGSLDHTDDTASGWGYAVFGKVVAGMDVVDAIVKSPRTTIGPYQDVPSQAITIQRVGLLQ
jgi:cyclophilin family peptidyl-prolyl cis-trans isomerase